MLLSFNTCSPQNVIDKAARSGVIKAPKKLMARCSLPQHLLLQICCDTQQPIDEIVVPLDATLEQLKTAAGAAPIAAFC